MKIKPGSLLKVYGESRIAKHGAYLIAIKSSQESDLWYCKGKLDTKLWYTGYFRVISE